MRISDWSSDVCSSDLPIGEGEHMDVAFLRQFSVYARFCNGKDSFDSHLGRIERNLPEKGDVHVLTFTDRQYENIVRFSSQRRKRKIGRASCRERVCQYV